MFYSPNPHAPQIMTAPHFPAVSIKRGIIGTGTNPDGIKIRGTSGKTWVVFTFMLSTTSL
jgi:hypothetical protein